MATQDKYIIVSRFGAKELQKEINEKMEQGYTPIGGMSIEPILKSTVSIYYQALLKPAVKKEVKRRKKV